MDGFGGTSEGKKLDRAAEIKRLQTTATALAADHVGELVQALVQAENLALEITAGGDVYKVGVRQECDKVAEFCKNASQLIAQLQQR